MHPNAFQEAIAAIIRNDSRYEPDAYFFLKDALDFTVKQISEERKDLVGRHVSGGELLEGFRDFACEQFGPMAHTVLREWGIKECLDIGHMVFSLINEQVFGKQDSDCIEDFSNIFTFQEAFVDPFLPGEEPMLPSP